MITGFVWVRPLQIERWVDGDTVHGLVDMGDSTYKRFRKGIRVCFPDMSVWDAPEMKQEPARATAALGAAQLLAPYGMWIVSTSHSTEDGFGRPLYSLTLSDGADFATRMTEMGHAK